MKSLAKDDPRAQEADPGNNLRRHAGRTVLAGKQAREHHKAGRTNRDQRVGPQAGHLLTQLAFESDARAHKGRHAQADSGLINRSVHCENPVPLVGTASGPEPEILRTAQAIAFQIRQLEDRYVKSRAADAGVVQDVARQPKDSNGPQQARVDRNSASCCQPCKRPSDIHRGQLLNTPAPGRALGAATVRKRDLTGNTGFHRARPACPPGASSIPAGHCDQASDKSVRGTESGADPWGGGDPEGCHWNRRDWKA
jgi:hypothetical protein